MFRTSSNELEELAARFKALSNANRLRLFMQLLECCAPGTRCDTTGDTPTCVGALGRDLGIAASTISHHMKELRQAGLVQMQRRGQNIECWIEPAVLEDLARFFGSAIGTPTCCTPTGKGKKK